MNGKGMKVLKIVLKERIFYDFFFPTTNSYSKFKIILDAT